MLGRFSELCRNARPGCGLPWDARYSGWNFLLGMFQFGFVDRNGQPIEFFSPRCKCLKMNQAESENIAAHVLQARWFAERLERMNEALVTLSGTFIGFLGIELAFLGQLSAEETSVNWTSTISSRVSVVFIILSILFFFITMKSDDFEMPDLGTLRRSWHEPKNEILKEPLRILIDQDDNFNIIKSLEKENEDINKWYPIATALGLIGQLSLVIFLFAKWA